MSGTPPTDDPDRLRRKAETCERLMLQMTDLRTVQILKALASEYRARARLLQGMFGLQN